MRQIIGHTQEQLAKQLHSLHHQNSNSLREQFSCFVVVVVVPTGHWLDLLQPHPRCGTCVAWISWGPQQMEWGLFPVLQSVTGMLGMGISQCPFTAWPLRGLLCSLQLVYEQHKLFFSLWRFGCSPVCGFFYSFIWGSLKVFSTQDPKERGWSEMPGTTVVLRNIWGS